MTQKSLLRWFQQAPIFDQADVEARLKKRLSRMEFFGLMFAIFTLLAFTFKPVVDAVGFDWRNYLTEANRPFETDVEYFYPYWVLPVVWVIGLVGQTAGYFIWGLFNIGGAWFATRTFGGKLSVVFLCYQMLYMLFYGQIVGVMMGGVALFWYGISRRKWETAGIGVLFGALKYQSGLPVVCAIWLLADLTWRERLRVLVLPITVTLISLVIYPQWPLEILDRLHVHPADASASISLWRYIGPLALALWLPTMLFRMSFSSRVILVSATAALTMPYFQQADLLLSIAMPLGWLPLTTYAGYFLLPVFGWKGLQALAIFPAVLYLWLNGRAARNYYLQKRQRVTISPP